MVDNRNDVNSYHWVGMLILSLLSCDKWSYRMETDAHNIYLSSSSNNIFNILGQILNLLHFIEYSLVHFYLYGVWNWCYQIFIINFCTKRANLYSKHMDRLISILLHLAHLDPFLFICCCHFKWMRSMKFSSSELSQWVWVIWRFRFFQQ